MISLKSSLVTNQLQDLSRPIFQHLKKHADTKASFDFQRSNCPLRFADLVTDINKCQTLGFRQRKTIQFVLVSQRF